MQNKIESFVVFIISHGRPDNVYTKKTLDKQNFKGDWLIVLDNKDKTYEKYEKNFGNEHLYVFDKEKIAHTTDHADNFWNLRTTTHARNACFEIAKELGYDYFLVLDDDYTSFRFAINDKKEYITSDTNIEDINPIFQIFFEFMQNTEAHSIAFGQGGDFIGGDGCSLWKHILKRKCMNSWFCKTDRYFQFFSRLNEDVNTYVNLGKRGYLFFTARDIRLEQKSTQATKGGMTEAYLDGGTYVKSFYSVMIEPAFVKCSLMGNKINRIHHVIKWKNAVPKIIREEHKKSK